MKSKPLVSILITNYNSEAYVAKCLNSCFNQKYRNIEIIFYDDASTDNVIKIISKYKKRKNFKIIANKKKITKYGSYNQIFGLEKCLKLSRGKIICLLDGDDFFARKKIYKIVKFFNKNRKISFVCDLPIIFFNKSKKIFSKKNYSRISNASIWPRIKPTSCISMRRNFFISAIKKLKTKEFHNIWIDFRLSIYAYYIKKNFYVLNENLTYYVQRPKNISSNFHKFSKNWWIRRNDAHEYLKKLFKKFNKKHKIGIDYIVTKIMKKFL